MVYRLNGRLPGGLTALEEFISNLTPSHKLKPFSPNFMLTLLIGAALSNAPSSAK